MRELSRRIHGEPKVIKSFREFIRSVKSLPQEPRFARIEFRLRRALSREHLSETEAIYKEGIGWIDDELGVVNLEELTAGNYRPERLNLITGLQDREKGNTGFRQLKNDIIAKLRERGYHPSFAFFKLNEWEFLQFRFPIDIESNISL